MQWLQMRLLTAFRAKHEDKVIVPDHSVCHHGMEDFRRSPLKGMKAVNAAVLRGLGSETITV